MTHQNKIKVVSFLVTATLSSMTHASGFAIIEQSVTGLGAAFAGSAAAAEDASSIFFNPAGLTNLDRSEIDVALNYIAPQAEFSGEGYTPFGSSLTGGNGGDAGPSAIVPNFYYSRSINQTTVFGLGINAPFGLVTEYDENWKGRYHAVKSDLKTININPTLAFKTTEKLSLGFGLNVQKAEVELTSMADLGAMGGANFSQTSDGKINVEADDWSWGYNLGLTYQVSQTTRLGLAYRSKISHTLKGAGKITQQATGNTIASGNILGKISLPESLSLAVHHQINKKWALLADASWTRWSRFKDLTIAGDGTFPSSSKPENWSNSMRYGLGLTYQHSDKWKFRTGIAYDETPISDEFRTPRIPGNDRTWLAVGASYQYSENIVIDAGYSHLFVSNTTINDTDSNGYNISGSYDGEVDILAVQVRWLL